MRRTPDEIVDDEEGRFQLTFQEAVVLIIQLVAPARSGEIQDLANTSPNQVRRTLDQLLDDHPVAPEDEEKVLRIAWAYGELTLIRALGRHLSPDAHKRSADWAESRIRRRIERRRIQREAGAPFDSRAQSLGGDVPDSEVRIMHAAIRLFDGTVLGGEEDGSHPEVAESLDPAFRPRLEEEVESEGFVDSHGNYLDRGQTSTVTGVPGESSEVAGTLQGRPLRKVQERALRSEHHKAKGMDLDEEEAADALEFLDQFRIDREL